MKSIYISNTHFIENGRKKMEENIHRHPIN